MLNELSEIVNQTLMKRIHKSIVGKLINSKVNSAFDAPVTGKKILKLTDELAEELYKPVTEHFKVGESTLTVSMKLGS